MKPTEGQALTNVLLATFTDNNPQATVRDFKATIDWGDGSPLDSGVIHLAGDNTSSPVTVVQVSGSHTYAEEGSDTAVVTLIDVYNPLNPVTATVPVTISDAPLVATEKALISATVGVPAPDNTGGSGALVATFTDGNPVAVADDFTTTINWGDGTSSAGTVTPLGGGVFTVSGTHTFGTPGNDTVTVTIVDEGGNSTITTAGAVVAPLPVLPATALKVGRSSRRRPWLLTPEMLTSTSQAPRDLSRPPRTRSTAATIRILPVATSFSQPAPTGLGGTVSDSNIATVRTSVRSWPRAFRQFHAAGWKQQHAPALKVHGTTRFHESANSRHLPHGGTRG